MTDEADMAATKIFLLILYPQFNLQTSFLKAIIFPDIFHLLIRTSNLTLLFQGKPWLLVKAQAVITFNLFNVIFSPIPLFSVQTYE